MGTSANLTLAMTEEFPGSDDLPARFGKAMLVGAWIAALAVLVLFFQRFIDHETNPNPDPEGTFGIAGQPQVVLQRNRAGHYVAGGRINGHPVVFLLDTGATNIAIPLSLARRLDLSLRPGGVSVTANGNVRTWSALLQSVDLGGLAVRNLHASVLPNMEGNKVLLGMSYLKRFEMIQRGDTLTLRRPS